MNMVNRCYINAAGDVECFLLDCADQPNSAIAVQDYNAAGVHDFVAWGELNGVDWCCTIDDDPMAPTIDEFTIFGCENFPGDLLSFQWPIGVGVSVDNMKPHNTAQLLGNIYGGDGTGGFNDDRSDWIWGSDYVGSGYRDFLDGEEGNDTIDGGGDGDCIHGGVGADALYGSGGNDRMVGDEDATMSFGRDDLFGEDGNDTLCDADDAAGTQHMQGGNGNDTLWLTNLGFANGWDAASSCNAGVNQRFGDSGAFFAPGGCVFGIAVEPPDCTCP